MNLILTIRKLYLALAGFLQTYLESLSLLFLRLVGANVFLRSGLSKWNGWFDFDEQKYDLFLYEFFCPDPVREGALLLCDPATLDYTEGSSTIGLVESFALMAGILEVVLPVLLIVGLLTRISALGLLVMTLFIQLAVFPTWDHWWNPAAWWAVTMFALLARGGGSFAIDSLLRIEVRPTH